MRDRVADGKITTVTIKLFNRSITCKLEFAAHANADEMDAMFNRAANLLTSAGRYGKVASDELSKYAKQNNFQVSEYQPECFYFNRQGQTALLVSVTNPENEDHEHGLCVIYESSKYLGRLIGRVTVQDQVL